MCAGLQRESQPVPKEIIMKKKSLIFMLVTCLVFAFALTGCSKKDKTESGAADAQESAAAETNENGETVAAAAETGENGETVAAAAETVPEEPVELMTGKHHATITVANYGKIMVELDADTAPITVTNFITLAKDGFYDGLTFHRIIDGFMIQGGDPDGSGTGGSGKNIKGEFSANGIENAISHTKGTISMARGNDFNSASSQFFIMVDDALYLDGQYAGFGHVTDGQDVVDKIAADAQPVDSNGLIAADAQPVIQKIEVVD